MGSFPRELVAPFREAVLPLLQDREGEHVLVVLRVEEGHVLVVVHELLRKPSLDRLLYELVQVVLLLEVGPEAEQPRRLAGRPKSASSSFWTARTI